MAAARGGLQRSQQSALRQHAWYPRWIQLHNRHTISMRTACVPACNAANKAIVSAPSSKPTSFSRRLPPPDDEAIISLL